MSRRERRLQEEREAKERKKQEKLERKNRRKKHKIQPETIENEPKDENIFLKIIKGFFTFLLIFILIIVLIVAVFLGYLGFRYDWNPKKMLKGGAKEVALIITGQTEEDVANLDPIYCLVMGVSTDEGLLLTDTLIVCAYYPRTQQASMMSIPRDTFVGRSEATATSGDKINAVYANYEGGKRGAEKLLDFVEKVTNLKIDNYIVVKNEGLIQIVDAIGGVEFNVPINMDYDDWSQDLHIHLTAGKQKIDGAKAEQLLRFRHNTDFTTYPESYGGEDIGRTRTQREFITETIKQTLKFNNVTKINELIDIAFKNTETNMDMNYVMKYSPAAVEFNADALQNSYLPGSPVMYNQISFYKPNKSETKELVNEMFTFKQAGAELNSEDESILNPEYIKIQLLDGTGNKEAFKALEKRLEDKGYNIKSEEVTSTIKNTRVINRAGLNEATLDELVNCLGYGECINGKVNSDYDITIIVGQDMLGLETGN